MPDGMVDPARVEALFHAVVDLAHDDARRILDRECRHAPALREEVERLLWHDRMAPAEFLAPAVALAVDAAASAERIGEASQRLELSVRPSDRVGRFTILRSLGEGAMGIVYMAYDESLDRCIALKVLRRGLKKPESLAHEARALARVLHPNVVQVYELGEHEGQPFVAMELVAGRSLRAWLRERPRSAVEVIHTFVQAGKGLAAAHEAGLVHRDFKPDNVLVGADGRVRVVDFGICALAERAGPLSGEALPAGTPAFMAPEQFAGRGASAGSDQFAFCVAVFRALYGIAPFAGDDVPTLRRNVLEGALATPPTSPAIPTWIARVLTRGLSGAPEARFPSMKHLLAAIERRLPLPGLDPAVGRSERRLVAALSGTVGATALALIAGSWASIGVEPSLRAFILIPSVALLCQAIAAVALRRQLLGNRFSQKVALVVWIGIATVVLHRLVAVQFCQPTAQVLAIDMLVLATQHLMAAVLFEPWFGFTAALFITGATVAIFSSNYAAELMLGSVVASYALAAVRMGL
jgi:serine/threonine-protein kinase